MTVIEAGPGSVLTGLARKVPDTTALAVESSGFEHILKEVFRRCRIFRQDRARHGASQGIGALSRVNSADCGATVAINYYPGMEEAAEALVAELCAAGGRAMSVAADVTDADQVASMVDAVMAEYGAIDVLVNNAGITRDGLLVRMSDADWNAVISTNLTGVFTVTRAVARHMMKARSGSIVNVASVVGLVGNAGQANYSAAKAGVIGLTKDYGARTREAATFVQTLWPRAS